MNCQTLASKEGLGRVVVCKGCSDVHLVIDNVTMRVTQDAFVALTGMLQEAVRHPRFCNAQGDPRFFMGSQLFSRA